MLLIFSTLAAFSGCETEEKPDDETGSENEVVNPGEVDFPEIERKDYGLDFNLYVAEANGTGNFYMDEDMNNGSAMHEAVFRRQEMVRKYLGVDFVLLEFPDAKYNTYQQYVQIAVQNMDGTMDALITHVHGGVSNMISENMLTDLSEFEGIDLDAEYWHKPFMDTLELNGNYFLGHSDYNLLMTYVIGFNKELLDQYDAALDKSVYDLVRDKEWTLAQLMSIAQLLAIDADGIDGKSDGDYFGFTGIPWVAFNGFLTSSDIPMVARTQSGAYEVALTKPEYYSKTNDLVELFRDMRDANYTYFGTFGTSGVTLSSGHAMMQVISTDDLPKLLGYDIEFGVLPFPMYDENQASVGYKSLQWGGYIGVLSYLKNPLMVGETLEMLAYYSENVKITFYQKVLGKRVAEMPDDAEMLEIVWDSVTTDVGQTFYNLGGDETGVCYTLPDLMKTTSTQNLASYLKSKESAINLGFRKFLNSID